MTVLTSNLTSTTTQNEMTEAQSVELHDQKTLREYVEISMANYFEQVGDQKVADLYELVISEVEAPLMEAVMKYTRNNQTKASTTLGLNRGTLRKKLKKYDML